MSQSSREEIREGMRSHLKRFYTRCFGKEPEGLAIDYLEHCLKNQEMWLASMDVAIKVEGELPERTKLWGTDERREILEAAYTAWEPLIDVKLPQIVGRGGEANDEPLIEEVTNGRDRVSESS